MGILILISNEFVDYSNTILKGLIFIIGFVFTLYGLVIFYIVKRNKKNKDSLSLNNQENQNKEFKNKPKIIDKKDWTGKNFEFLITGDITIPNSDFDRIMTPNSFNWEKIKKNNWIYYKVGKDEYSFSFEIPGIQF